MTKTQFYRIAEIVKEVNENHSVIAKHLYDGDEQLLVKEGLTVKPINISVYILPISQEKLNVMEKDHNELIQRICRACKSKYMRKSIFCDYSEENVELLKKYHLYYHVIKYMITDE